MNDVGFKAVPVRRNELQWLWWVGGIVAGAMLFATIFPATTVLAFAFGPLLMALALPLLASFRVPISSALAFALMALATLLSYCWWWGVVAYSARV